jgi:hypothetical protein
VSSHSNQNNAQCQFTVRQIINNNKNLDIKFSEHDAQNRNLRIEQILNGEEFECTWSLALRKTVISRSSHNYSCIASSG